VVGEQCSSFTASQVARKCIEVLCRLAPRLLRSNARPPYQLVVDAVQCACAG